MPVGSCCDAPKLPGSAQPQRFAPGHVAGNAAILSACLRAGPSGMRLEFLHPKFWITWVGLCLMRSLELLPYAAQRRAGSAIGMLLQHLPLHFKRIARRNIDLCLPELGEAERAALVDRHFRSLGMALCETANTWWSSDARVNKLADVQGLQ